MKSFRKPPVLSAVLYGLLVLIFLTGAPAFAQPRLQWADGFIANGSSNWADAITADHYGNSYTVGYITSIVDFDPGPGVLNISPVNGGTDGYICKLDPLGNLLWVRTIGGNSTCTPSAATIDSSGNIYVTGGFSGTVDFDPGAGVYNLTAVANASSVFVLKLDTAGQFLWARTIFGTSVSTSSVSTDTAGHCYISGKMSGTVDFDPGAGTWNLSGLSGFIWKLRSDGTLGWARNFSGTTSAASVHCDDHNEVVTCGGFVNTADLDPGPGTYTITGAGAYICKLDTGGSFIWGGAFNGLSLLADNAIAEDGQYNLYLTGRFANIADLDPGPGVYNLASNGDLDVVVVKIDNTGSLVYARHMGGAALERVTGIAVDTAQHVYLCGNFFSDVADFDPDTGTFNLYAPGGVQTGFFMRLQSDGRFDWAYSLNALGNCMHMTGPSRVACSGFFNSLVDFDPGNDTAFITAAWTSIFVFQLQEPCHTPPATLDTTVCGPYTSPSGMVYFNNGTYLDTIHNLYGCDSIITIHLTYMQEDISVLINGATIISNATGVTYQWLDCDNNMAVLQGETGQSYTAGANGHFAVIVGGACMDTSLCYFIDTFTGVNEPGGMTNFTIYPNPASGWTTITTGLHGRLQMFDSIGRELWYRDIQAGTVVADISQLQPGIYTVMIMHSKGRDIAKLVVR